MVVVVGTANAVAGSYFGLSFGLLVLYLLFVLTLISFEATVLDCNVGVPRGVFFFVEVVVVVVVVVGIAAAVATNAGGEVFYFAVCCSFYCPFYCYLYC